MKMKSIIFPFILLTYFLLQGCVPQMQTPSGRASSNQYDSTDDSLFDFDDPDAANISDSEMAWYSNGIFSATNGSMTLNETTTDSIYIRGKAIEFYLDTMPDQASYKTLFDYKHCLVLTFDTVAYSGTKRQVRVRAVPMTYTDHLTGQSEKLLRITLPDGNENSTQCNGELKLLVGEGGVAEVIDNTNAVFSLPDFCPTCSTTIPIKEVGIIFLMNSILMERHFPHLLKQMTKKITTKS